VSDEISVDWNDVATAGPGPFVRYVQGLRDGRLGFQRCIDCLDAVFYPRTICPHCGGGRLTWYASAGVGAVYAASTVTVRSGQPYNVVLVDLDEGFRVMSTVVDGGSEIAVGSRVVCDIRPAGAQDDIPVLRFRPLEVLQ